jgi:hypothetical protein
MYKRLFLGCLALLLFANIALAQRTTGVIAGRVIDPKGLAVPGAKVTVSNESTGFKRELTALEDGSFYVPDLPPADYKVTVAVPNFKTYQTTVTVLVERTASVTAKLEIGQVSVIVQVEGGVVTVDTTKATVQGTVTGNQIDSIPLNGRNFLELAQLDPGVQTVDGGNFDPTKNQMVGVSVGGRSGRVTRIQVDGVDITDETVGTTVANISNESIQEFTINQSSLDASTDLTSSGSVNIVTRSGTNSIHGSGYFLWRDAKFAADQRLAKSGPKPPFERKNGGFRAGGPFIKNRWFWHVEGEKTNQAGQQITNTPNFPAFTGAFGVPVLENMAGIRTDYNITSRWKAFYRFFHNDNVGVTGFGGVNLSAFGNRNNTNIHVAGVDFGGSRWTHQFRFSYLNFNNFIAPANSLAGTPLALDSSGKPVASGGVIDLTKVLLRIDGQLQDIGPNLLAPQQTFQDNRQTKYDGGVTFGRHVLRFGADWNHIEQFVFASFFGLGPRIRAAFTSTPITGTKAIAALNLFGPGGIQNPLNYPARQVRMGNGLGFFSEKPALGFPFGGTANNRLGFYAHDTWKWKSNVTLNFGLRYNWNSALSNHDLQRAPLIGVFDPELAGFPHRDANDFAPQAGFAWNLFGNSKTVIRGGAGIFYETNIFNNLLFDRVLNVPAGIGNDTPILDAGNFLVLNPANGATLFNFKTQCTGINPSSTTPNSCFGAPIGKVVPFAIQAQQLLQAATKALTAGYPQPGVPAFFNSVLTTEGSVLDPNYKTPYGIQMNIGVQHEFKPGLVLSVDYLRNRGVHFNLIRDRNRIGAADTLDTAIALGAMNATIPGFCDTGGAIFNSSGNFTGCPINTTTMSPGSRCSTFATMANQINCTITGGASISDYAGNGLGAGSALDGNAFRGKNPNFRSMGIIEPAGLSLFQALQVRLTGDIGKFPRLGIKRLHTNITYQLGRFESTGADQDFLSGAGFNDRPTQFFGPANLDRTHQIGVSFLMDLPWGFTLGTTNSFKSALPSSMFLPVTTGQADEIFFSDLDGDGVTQDPLTGVTPRGAFSRQVKASDINKFIKSYNSKVAGTVGPAGQALIAAGLFTKAQLVSLGAVLTSVPLAPSGQVNNDSAINTDIRISNRIKIKERWTIEPMVEIFNLFNIANYTALGDVLDNSIGAPNGTTASTRPTRVGQGSGAFSPGTQRAFQFGIRVSF